MNIVIGADHRGFAHKQYIQQHLKHFDATAITWIDVGADNDERSDYPVYCKKSCELMRAGNADFGVLICATGVGMAIAANRYRGIYAALVWNTKVARLAKEHDRANILVLPSDFVDQQQAVEIIEAWLRAAFRGDRYQNRVDMIDQICSC